MKVNSIEDVERFLSIQEQALGSNNPEVAITLQRLAALYLDNGDLLKAESIYERALSILELQPPLIVPALLLFDRSCTR